MSLGTRSVSWVRDHNSLSHNSAGTACEILRISFIQFTRAHTHMCTHKHTQM